MKKIIIIGGGISGLTLLYHLREKYGPQADTNVILFEKETLPGGHIRTHEHNKSYFETGPSSFLGPDTSTLALAHELNLSNVLVQACPTTKNRYICVHNKLFPITKSPMSLLRFPFFSLADKLRIFAEIFVKKNSNENETVYEFGTRRLGEKFSRYFLDPMVSGIFGGDAKNLNLKAAFPKMYQLEQEYGSLFKALIKRRKFPSQQIWSFEKGMSQLTDALYLKGYNSIRHHTPVTNIFKEGNQYNIRAMGKNFFADQLILSLPAYAAAELLTNIDPKLCVNLKKINYSSITVVGFVYSRDQFNDIPQGFGYLRPTSEGSEVLGVIFNSQIFPTRCPQGKVLFQIMLGGACHPETILKTNEQIFDLARTEIEKVLGAKGEPEDKFLQRWPKAIPQYDSAYPGLYREINDSLSKHHGLYLLANYWNGISLNDCTKNARNLAELLANPKT